MRGMLWWMVGTVITAPADAQAPGEAINLVCTGRGEKLGSGYVNTLEWDRYDHRFCRRGGRQPVD